MLSLMKEKFIEVLKAIGPIIIIICTLQFALVNAPTPLFLQFLIGALMMLGGLVLFYVGIDIGLLPMGRFVGAGLPPKGSFLFIMTISAAIGFVTTVAEPDVLVLSKQVDVITQGVISRNAVLYLVATGVGLFVALAMLRIVLGVRMVFLLTAAYLLTITLTLFAPSEFVPLAYDAGSVTTGAVTTPVVLALSLGLSSVLANRSAISDGFGLLGFSSIGPIIIILLMGILFH